MTLTKFNLYLSQLQMWTKFKQFVRAMESINLNNGILAEELVSLALLEDGFNVARPVRIGPIDLLLIWDGKVINRLLP